MYSDMKLDDIEKYWLEDSHIDTTNLTRASVNIPKLHSKYYSFLNKEIKTLHRYKVELQQLEFVLERFYGRKLTQDELDKYGLEYPEYKVLKPEIPKHVSNHEDIIKYNTQIALQQAKIEYLKSILKEISAMSFQIRNIIENEKFKNGSV